MVKRGLMRMGEKSVPFVPGSAVLCPAHKELNPWRIRNLFTLLAVEIIDKMERMRHYVKKKYKPADTWEFRDFVERMNSVQALWMEPDTFRHIWKFEGPFKKFSGRDYQGTPFKCIETWKFKRTSSENFDVRALKRAS
ncbi:hypothetical protein C8035_v011392 [Colletotrichum spinosum]|uniref:Uncharacterized protein n=1 Tax=Colletotrichum spinosum TaxID=1347390 RepID=A0A4R8PUF0_9PEZI|nr:hypothetical protein C8035_v011392 [Colletotrichum spinosum]